MRISESKFISIAAFIVTFMMTVILAMILSGRVYAAWDGTTMQEVSCVDNTYTINTVEQLAWIQNQSETDNFSGKKLMITGTFDFGNQKWNGIGSETNPFVGNIEIRNAMFSNMGRSGQVCSGIFDVVQSDNVVIQNVIVSDCTFYFQSIGTYKGKPLGCIFDQLTISEQGKVSINHYSANQQISVSSSGLSGGIIGKLILQTDSQAEFENCKIMGQIKSNDSTANASGGLIGYLENSGLLLVKKTVIEEKEQKGIYGKKYAGGLAGQVVGNGEISLFECSVREIVESFTSQGICAGLIGQLDNACSKLWIENCFVSNILSAATRGGFVGNDPELTPASKVSVKNSLFMPYLSGDYNFFSGIPKSINCSFCAQKSLSNSSNNVMVNGSIPSNSVGKSLSSLKLRSTYEKAGWDLDTVWYMVEGSYPKLLCEFEQPVITATAGTGGSISNSGYKTDITKGSSLTYTITPDTGYEILDVLVDGESVGAISSYTFENIQENHVISVTFRKSFYKGCTLILNGKIGICYYMDYTDDATNAEWYRMRFWKGGDEDHAVIVSGETTETANERTYTYEISAKEMADTVHAQLLLTDQSDNISKVGPERTYSAVTYAKHMLDSSESTETLKTLLKSLLNYGAEAQQYFKYQTDNLANAILSEADRTVDQTVDLSSFEGLITKQESEAFVATFDSTSMILNGDTVLRYDLSFSDQELNSADYIMRYCVSGDAAPAADSWKTAEINYDEQNKVYYAEITGIAAKDLNVMYDAYIAEKDKLSESGVTPGRTSQIIHYGPFSYCYDVTTNEPNTQLANLCYAMVNYQKAAEAYFNQEETN